MTKAELEELKEKLADIEHQRWADWQKYMHSLCSKLGDLDTDYALVIPSKSVTHWERQIATPYAELSDREKASDMEQVDRYWPLILALISKIETEARVEELNQLGYETAKNGWHKGKASKMWEYVADRLNTLKANTKERGSV